VSTSDLATIRSFLYVPGDRSDMVAKATNSDADAVIIDLEDGVGAAAKDKARDIVASWLVEQQQSPIALWVRINSQPEIAHLDLDAVVQPALAGIYVPKVSATADVESVANKLDDLEASNGVAQGAVQIAPLLETAAGVLAAPDIAASRRVSHLAIGEADLAADLGMRPSPDGRELDPIRISVVVASAAAKINPPIGPVDTKFRDLESLRATSRQLRQMGYGGRAAIHPDQIPIINEAFSPTPEELAAARDIVHRFDAAQQAGDAITLAEDGSLIDEAVVRLARLTLSHRSPTTTKE